MKKDIENLIDFLKSKNSELVNRIGATASTDLSKLVVSSRIADNRFIINKLEVILNNN